MITAARKTERQYGVTEAAKMLGRTTGRIRQLCIAHDIGICYGAKYRVLTPQDVRRLRGLIRPDSR